MRNSEDANKFKKEGLKPHQIVLTITTKECYEEIRKMLLKDINDLEDNEYLLLEGYHCSCYDFDDTRWQGTVYTREELKKISRS